MSDNSPLPTPHFPLVRVTHLLATQRETWEQGGRISVEVLLQQHPVLEENSDGLLDLIYNEIFLREQKGESPQLEEYLLRFPDLADSIRAQFDVHQAIQTCDSHESLLFEGRRVKDLSLYLAVTGEVFSITKAITVIGRSEECDLVLKQTAVSRRHCRIVWTPEKVFVEDLDTPGGTYVNGLRAARAQLSNGDRLQFGGLVLEVRLR